MNLKEFSASETRVHKMSEPVNCSLFSLIGKAVAIGCPRSVRRSSTPGPHKVRPGVEVMCGFKIELNDPMIATSDYAVRRFCGLRAAA